MDDLISRQEAITHFVKASKNYECGMFDLKELTHELWQIPSAQPKTGRWKTAMLDHEAFGVRPKVLYCSECNQCIAYPTRYCPNCGAKMDAEP